MPSKIRRSALALILVATAVTGCNDRISRQGYTISRLSRLYNALSIYASDHRGQLPHVKTGADLKAALYPAYINDAGCFVDESGRPFHVLFMPATLVDAQKKSPILLFASSTNSAGRVPALLGNGQVRMEQLPLTTN